MLFDTLVYLGVGTFAGLLAGMLGVGGGIIIVPMLSYALLHQGYSPESVVHLAIGTSIATITVTSLSALRAHHSRGSVDWSVFRRFAPWLIAGAVAGGSIADYFSTRQLLLLLAIIEFFVAVQLLVNIGLAGRRAMPGRLGSAPLGILVGGVSTTAGVGGGVLLVPLFLWFSTPIRVAVGTSSACGFTISLAGSLVFLSYGFSGGVNEAGSFGYVHLPAFAGIAIASVVSAPFGVAAAHRLPIEWLRRVFAVFLLLLAMRILWVTLA
jgi:uncharacterized membrane protein YfcA